MINYRGLIKETTFFRIQLLRNLTLFLFVFAIQLNATANRKADSLTGLIIQSGEDVKKVDLLNLLSQEVLEENHDLAINYAEEAHKLAKKLNYQKGLFNALNFLGRVHTNYTLNFSKAVLCFTDALKLCEKENTEQQAGILAQLAFINNRQGNSDKAIKYYEESIAIAKKHKQHKEVANLSAYLSEVYEERGDTANALLFLKNVFDIEKQTNFENTGPAALTSIAHYYELQNQLGPAETYLLDALKIFQQNNNFRWTSYTFGLLSKLYLKKKDYTSALNYASAGLKVAQDYKLSKEIADNHLFLSAVYDSLKDYKNAFMHFKRVKSIDDSIFDIEKTKEITNIQSLYEASIKEENTAKALLDKEISESRLRKTQIAFAALLIVFVLLVVLTVMLNKNYRMKQAVNAELENRGEFRELKLDEIIKQLNREIIEHQQTKSKLEVINAELNNFMYRSSHDLKGPLASIAGLTNMAKANVSEAERMEYISMISKSASKLNTLIEDLVEATKVTHANIEPTAIDFKDFVNGIIDDLKNSEASRDVEFITDIDKNLSVNTDKHLIRTILYNLIENAIKYKSISGNKAFVKISAHKVKRSLVFSVSDNGQGINEASRLKVFDMFLRANDTVPGTGLGLYLVKKSVTRLGGKIELESKEGEGSKFEITLPDLMQQETKLLLFDF